MKNMRISKNMRQHEAFPGLYASHLFCSDFFATKQISGRTNRYFCLINPHNPHTFAFIEHLNYENMRIMRIYEEGLFNGNHLRALNIGLAGGAKHEDRFGKHEDYLHVLEGRWQ